MYILGVVYSGGCVPPIHTSVTKNCDNYLKNKKQSPEQWVDLKFEGINGIAEMMIRKFS